MITLVPGCLSGRESVVFGCGPSLDDLPRADFIRLVDSDPLFTVALNFTPLTKLFLETFGCVNVNLWRDEIALESPLRRAFQQARYETRVGEGQVVKIGAAERPADFDSLFDSAPFPQTCGAAGNAIGLLDFLGCRRITLVGVDLWGGGYAAFSPVWQEVVEAGSGESENADGEQSKSNVAAWAQLRKLFAGRVELEFIGDRSLLGRAGLKQTTAAAVLERVEHAA